MTVATYNSYDSVTVRRVVFPRAVEHQPDPAYRMTMSPVDQPTLILRVPYAPREVTYTRGSDYADVARVGKKPALVWKNTTRKEISMTLTVADKYGASNSPTAPKLLVSADSTTDQITGWADRGTRLRVTYGPYESGIWRITNLSIRSIQRTSESNNQFTLAELTITFTEVVDPKVGTGPVSGGVKPAPSKTTSAPKTRTYTVRKGDTLWGISIKYYGTGTKWRKIADANKIKNVNSIKPGQVLKIPS